MKQELSASTFLQSSNQLTQHSNLLSEQRVIEPLVETARLFTMPLALEETYKTAVASNGEYSSCQQRGKQQLPATRKLIFRMVPTKALRILGNCTSINGLLHLKLCY